MDDRREVLVLGIGNMLWADEGFGVRAVEALNAAYAYPAPAVQLLDGGTLGLNLLEFVEASSRVLVFDAVDFGLPPGTLKVLRDDEVPRWGARRSMVAKMASRSLVGTCTAKPPSLKATTPTCTVFG